MSAVGRISHALDERVFSFAVQVTNLGSVAVNHSAVMYPHELAGLRFLQLCHYPPIQCRLRIVAITLANQSLSRDHSSAISPSLCAGDFEFMLMPPHLALAFGDVSRLQTQVDRSRNLVRT